MCSYVYILWSQYWKYADSHPAMTVPIGPKTNLNFSSLRLSQRITNIRSLNLSQLQFDFPKDKIEARIELYKAQLISQLRAFLIEANSNYNNNYNNNNNNKNQYNVWFRGTKDKVHDPQKLLCQLKKLKLKMLEGTEEPFLNLGLDKFFPVGDVMSVYNRCAVVMNSGSLHRAKLGKFIGKIKTYTRVFLHTTNVTLMNVTCFRYVYEILTGFRKIISRIILYS